MSARPSKFSPRSEPPEALLARTVCRDELFDRLVTSVVEAVAAGHGRFDLVLGPRGAGKSHLLGLVEHALSERLGDAAVLVSIPEDSNPGSLLHLLAQVLEPLLEPDEFKQRRSVLAASGEDGPDQASTMILAATGGRPLVLVAENFDMALAAIGPRGQKQLRRILQTQRNWSIIASARELAPAFAKESQPFFGTFVEHRLTPMSADCCREMLVALADQTGNAPLATELRTDAGLAHVTALRHVLGGYPRAMALVFPHLGDIDTTSLEDALTDLAEDLTPYFQEQLARLSPGQRPVAELLAESWRPLSVTEISEATLTQQASTSTHLRHLRRNALVIATRVGREVFYELADPLFRISRAMKTERLRATTLLRILRAWYGRTADRKWTFDSSDAYERRTQTTLPEFADLGSFHKQLLGRVIAGLRASVPRQLLDELGTIVEDRGDPIVVGWLAAALEAFGDAAAARSRLAALPRAALAEALVAIATLGGTNEFEFSAESLVYLARLYLRALGPGPQRADSRRELADRLRANEDPSEARLIREAASLLVAVHWRDPSLLISLLGARPGELSDLESAELSMALLGLWGDEKIDALGSLGADVLFNLAVHQPQPARTAISLAASLAKSASGGAPPALPVVIAAAAKYPGDSSLGTVWLATCSALFFDSIVRTQLALPEDDGAESAARDVVMRTGLQFWIGAGRAMEPVAAAADGLMRWAPSLDRRVLLAENPVAAFGMLPEAERRMVRQLAVGFRRAAVVEDFDRIAPPREY